MVARSGRLDSVQRTARTTGSASHRPAASVQGRVVEVVEEQAVPEHAVRVNAVTPGAVDTVSAGWGAPRMSPPPDDTP
ncbi:hypothetical protein ACGF3G_29985 [Streptomyces sp. NPDC048179]|uniref:hypothetical protein n=1 Tax=Streptomyces sp. NPDC048179 TaxID=3365506 RepID=UPI003718129C